MFSCLESEEACAKSGRVPALPGSSGQANGNSETIMVLVKIFFVCLLEFIVLIAKLNASHEASKTPRRGFLKGSEILFWFIRALFEDIFLAGKIAEIGRSELSDLPNSI